MVKVFKPTKKRRRSRWAEFDQYMRKRRRVNTVPRTNILANQSGNLAKFPGYGFPDRLQMKVAYTDVQEFSLAAAGGNDYNVYRLNSVYDPDKTGIGGQPYFRDQLAAIYNRYKVLGAKISVKFSRPSTTQGGHGPFLCGIQTGNNSALSASTAATLMSTAGVTYEVVGATSEPRTVVGTYSPKAAFGQLTDVNLSAAIGSNPSTEFNAIVFATNENGPSGTQASTITAFVTIEYLVEFTDLISNGGS